MKLTPRLTFVFVLYAALLLAAVGFLAYESGRSSLRSAVISELQSTAVEKQASLDSWVAEKQGDITRIAANPDVIGYVSDLVMAPKSSPEAQTARDKLVTEIQPSVVGGEFLTLLIMDSQTGQVIASTDPNEEGKFQEDRLFFIKGRLGPYVQNLYYSVTLQRPAMTAAAPLHAPDGHPLAVLAGRLDLDEMNAIITRRTGLHQTDDAFLVNTSSLFVTQPRFITDPSVLQRGVHTEAVRNCLAQTSGEIDQLDYRDVPTITVYRWLTERELCLIVKLDQSEAYAPARAFGETVAVISALALVVATGLAVFLSRGLTHPILALQAGAGRFGRGELDVRLPESSRDELGQLAHEFNDMAEALAEKESQLRAYAEELELKVEQRTEDLRGSEERFRSTFEQAAVGIAHVSPDGRFLRLNQRFCDLVGYSEKEMLSLTFQDITHPDDLDADLEFVRQVLADEIKTYSMEKRYIRKDQSLVWIKLTGSLLREPDGEPRYFIAVVQDIDELKNLEIQLQDQAENLRRSNAELEQFAYVASHDLQEPLRMVSSYVQLLAQRYQGRLDADADEFIAFAVDGATRMKSLINDLLTYSRVGTRGKPFASVRCDEALDQALENLQIAIEESRAVVERGPLPVVMGDDTQLIQLFQNLIGNAIKFRKEEPPHIRISAEERNEEWLFSVQDNGIGMEPQYLERVFIIFQRLHGRDQYPGTGMGLAICKKIVERHGGRIWAESEPGLGSTFHFVFPMRGAKNNGTEKRKQAN